MTSDVEAALAEVHMVGIDAGPPPKVVDPAVLEGLRASAQAAIKALPDPDPEPLPLLPELISPGIPMLQVTLDFVDLMSRVGEARAFEILARLKEATDA